MVRRTIITHPQITGPAPPPTAAGPKGNEMFELENIQDQPDVDDQETRDEIIARAYKEVGPFVPLGVKWEQTKGNHFQGAHGTDEHGNSYYMPANRETCHVRTPDGFTGMGWTAEEALERAQAHRKEVLERHYAVLEEMKSEVENPITITAPPSATFEDLVY